MGFEVVLVCAFLCMLQFHIGDADCVKLQLRVPSSSIDGYMQNPQFNTKVPYPLYRNGNNICNSCKGAICNSNCRSNNPFKLKSPPNSFVISVPSDKSKTGRLTITIDTRKPSPSDKAVPDVPADNGEKNKQDVGVDVIVKLVPKNETQDDPSTSTSGKSSATSNKNGEILTANTDGIVDIPGSDQALDVSVLVNDNNSGKGPSDTSLDSDIIADNGKGTVSKTDTQADIKKTPENESAPVNKPASASDEPVGEPKPADKPSDVPSSDPIPEDTPAPSDGSDSPATENASDPATPDDAAPEDTPTPGDSKTPEPIEAEPGPPPLDDDSVSSGTESGATADDEKTAADSTSGASADSG